MGMRVSVKLVKAMICMVVAFSVFCAVCGSAAGQITGGITLSCTEDSNGVDPAGFCQFTIVITNDGMIPYIEDSSVALAVSGAPDGWNASIAPQSVEVAAGGSAEAIVSIQAPEHALAGFNFSLNVTGTSSGALPLVPGSESSISITTTVNAVNTFEVVVPSGKNAKLNETISYEFIIKNTGNSALLVYLNAYTDGKWPVECPGSAHVASYSSEKILISTKVPANATEGLQKITLEAAAAWAPEGVKTIATTQAIVILENSDTIVIVNSEPNALQAIISLLPWIALGVALFLLLWLILAFAAKKNTTIRIVCDRFRREVFPCGGAVYNVRVENMGRANADVLISIPKVPSGWQARADYGKLHLKGGESKDVSITVKPLESANVGDEAEIAIVGKIAGSGKVASALTKTLLVDRHAKKVKVYGITNQPQRPQPKDGVRTEIFVKNEDLADAQATVKLYVNDELRGSKRVNVPAGRSVPAKFFWTCSKIENRLSAIVEGVS